MAEAETYRRLLDATELTRSQLAERLGVSDATVSSRLRLLELDEPWREQVRTGGMTLAAANKLLRKTDDAYTSVRARRPRTERSAIGADDVDVLEPVLLDVTLVNRARHSAAKGGEAGEDLISRAIRRELSVPTCRRCERRPALTGIGAGVTCGPGCPGGGGAS